jgi:hypothetical protein
VGTPQGRSVRRSTAAPPRNAASPEVVYHEEMKAGLALRALEFSLFTSAILLLAHPLMADQVAVRHLEGRIHGFLVLRDLDDNVLASGCLTQLYSPGPEPTGYLEPAAVG